MKDLSLSADQIEQIVEKKATCPFVGPAVREGALSVQNSPDEPLARVSDLKRIGDSGGGNLGELVLTFFANANHGRLPGSDGTFQAVVSEDQFSLDFPGSGGAHPGHSGILMGDPTKTDSGRFSDHSFDRLSALADKNGRLTYEAFGRFVAENVKRDPDATVLSKFEVAKAMLGATDDVIADKFSKVLGLFGRTPNHEDQVKRREAIVSLAQQDNLIGSAGEFGLLFALLANRPETEGEKDLDGIRLSDVKSMFVDKQLPEGWQNWPKDMSDWLHATIQIWREALKFSEHST